MGNPANATACSHVINFFGTSGFRWHVFGLRHLWTDNETSAQKTKPRRRGRHELPEKGEKSRKK